MNLSSDSIISKSLSYPGYASPQERDIWEVRRLPQNEQVGFIFQIAPGIFEVAPTGDSLHPYEVPGPVEHALIHCLQRFRPVPL